MKTITYGDAIREAIEEEMHRDQNQFMMGEDVEKGGGYLLGLSEEFGTDRIFDTPISEAGTIGAAVGAACTGCRVVVHLAPFDEFMIIGMDQIYNQAAKFHYMFGGKPKVPLVIRTAIGGYINAAEHHSQCLESWFAHAPGLICVAPSTPYDVKGLLKTAIKNDNPVMFFEHKLLYGMKGEVSEEEFLIPFGNADVKREGRDVTVVSYSYVLHKVLTVAEKLSEEISVEVIDIRTLTPLDEQMIITSVECFHCRSRTFTRLSMTVQDYPPSFVS